VPVPNKKLPLDLDSLARSYTEEAVRQIAAVLSNDLDTGRRLTAAGMMLDRGWGRPKQDNTHTLSGEVRVVLRKMLEDENENAAEENNDGK
jgi:hypothetical protein